MGKPVKKTLKAKKEQKPAEEEVAEKKVEKKEEGKKEAPKKDGNKKDGKKKEGQKETKPELPKREPVDPVVKAKFTKEAIAEILKGISEPDAQKGGSAFIPDTWHAKYKPVLGAYKRFVQSHPDTFTVHELERGNFVVIRPGDKPPATSITIGANWKKLLHKAWHAYEASIPKPEQSKEHFLQALGQRLGGSSASPKLSATASPKLSPKLAPSAPAASPKVAPADKGGDKGTKKDGKVLKKKKKA